MENVQTFRENSAPQFLKEHNLMKFFNNAFKFVKYSLPHFSRLGGVEIAETWASESVPIARIANRLAVLALHRMQIDFSSNIAYNQGLYDFYHVSVVCEKLKKKVCELTVKITSL